MCAVWHTGWMHSQNMCKNDVAMRFTVFRTKTTNISCWELNTSRTNQKTIIISVIDGVIDDRVIEWNLIWPLEIVKKMYYDLKKKTIKSIKNAFKKRIIEKISIWC